MELLKKQLLYRKMIASSILSIEESIDSIVSDSLPDIERIIDASAMIFIRDKQPRQDALSVKCNALMTVMYDSSENICTTQIPMTFTLSDTIENITPESEVMCDLSMLTIDARLINPRKVNVRLSGMMRISAYDNIREFATEGISDEKEFKTKTIDIDSFEIIATASRNFTVTDEVNFPIATDRLEKIIRYKVQVVSNELKVLNNKTVIKGAAKVSALVETVAHTLESIAFDVPFSQITDVSGATENAAASVSFELRSFDAEPTHDTGREKGSYDINIGLCANIIVSSTTKRRILTDIYSTANSIDIKTSEFSYFEPSLQMKTSVSVSENIETGSVVSKIESCDISYNNTVSKSALDEELDIPFTVNLIYSDNEKIFLSASRKMYAKFSDLSDGKYEVSADNVQSIVDSNGTVSVSFDVRLSAQSNQMSCVNQITDVQILNPLEKSKDTSAILRFVSADETLWSISKSYHTCAEAISIVNHLETNDVKSGTMLLIPMIR